MTQSALVKLMGNPGLFNIKSDDLKNLRIHPQDKMCLLVNKGVVTKLKDNTVLTEEVVEANQTIIIKPLVALVPHRYHALVSYNSQLTLAGALVSPLTLVVRPGEEDTIGLLIRTTKKLDLSEFSHIFELYLID